MWKLLQEPSVRSVMTHTITIRPLTMIGAPTSAGAYGPGQERAPEVFRRYGLVDAMAAKSIVAHDVGDVPGAEWRPDPSKPNAQNVEEVAKVASALGEQVARALAEGHDVLVLGGDCTVELGTVVGAAADGSHVALAYIDLDADLNTPLTVMACSTGWGCSPAGGRRHRRPIDPYRSDAAYPPPGGGNSTGHRQSH